MSTEHPMTVSDSDDKPHGIWSRLLALGFILLILLANVAFSYYVTGHDIPAWVRLIFEWLAALVLVSGSFVMIQRVLMRRRL